MTSGACTSHEAHGYRFITERRRAGAFSFSLPAAATGYSRLVCVVGPDVLSLA
jgi:hypothetical protein